MGAGVWSANVDLAARSGLKELIFSPQIFLMFNRFNVVCKVETLRGDKTSSLHWVCGQEIRLNFGS